MRRTRQQGFTLVELSIVLVIIGLILGGVMVGRSMIRASQVNRVTSDAEAYFAATQMFQDKYQGLPGDITNATTFWAAAANGDGDGIIDNPSAASTAGEIFGAWEQLALGGLIKGRYDGISGAGGQYHGVAGQNAPAGSLPSTLYSWRWLGTVTGGANVYNGYYGNFLHFAVASATSFPTAAALTPAEAYAIDLKTDNGIPGTGTVRTYYSDTNCNTGTATTADTSTYNTATFSGIACFLMFVPEL
jgi:prepilin-type N-terminal cleavage/methylation domain-containing protein